MNTNSSNDACGSRIERDLVLATYDALRPEILRAIDNEDRLVQLAIIALEAVITIALQACNGVIALAYPFLALLLALSWAGEERGIRQKGAYIADRIEFLLPKELDIGWDTFIR